jgi:acyl carrier protein
VASPEAGAQAWRRAPDPEGTTWLIAMSGAGEPLAEAVGAVIARALDLPAGDLAAAEARLNGRGLGLDSVDAVGLVAALEEAFDIRIDDDDLTPLSLRSVDSIVGLIRRLA